MKVKKRPNIKDIVADILQANYDLGIRTQFEDVYKAVKKERPESKFSPAHLSVYKSQFIKEKRDNDNRNA